MSLNNIFVLVLKNIYNIKGIEFSKKKVSTVKLSLKDAGFIKFTSNWFTTKKIFWNLVFAVVQENVL